MQRDREEWTVAEYLDAVRRSDATADVRLLRCAKRLAAAKAEALCLSREDAEDAAQRTCVIALADDGAALGRVGRASTLLSVWVASVLKHLLTDLVKSRASTERAPSIQASRRGEQRARAAAERTARIGPTDRARLNTLSPLRLDALQLHLQGLSYSEIGARRGIARDAAKDRVRRAWMQLKAKPRSTVLKVAALLADGRTRLDPVELETLEALSEGKRYKRIARERSETMDAVRSRVRRALRNPTHQ